ncbi:MAG TPA: SDR family NAD(P)-dependent oxidoreductase [Thermoplasmata archaeon]|nr:SDR family NAD(P)-dependent oxidoreductase [Thermoplasmata archaeon]
MSKPPSDGPVVVTGGAGGIGSVLVRALLAQGRTVRVVDNLSSGRRDHLPADAPRLEFVEADLRAPATYADAFRGAVEVWHLAANADIRRGTADPRVDLENGTLATFEVLEAARRAGIERVRYTSSSVVYGSATVLPTPESYGPLLPESLYAASKLGAEGLASAYAHSYGLTVHLFRFANIIDGAMKHGILYDLFEKLRRDPTRLEVLGDGSQAKSYLRTEDCVAALLLATERAHDRVNVFNVGNADRTSVREIAEKVVAAHGGRARIDFTGGTRGWTGDVPQQLLSIEKLRGLGWRPSLSSAGAIDRTVAELVAARAVPAAERRPALRGPPHRYGGRPLAGAATGRPPGRTMGSVCVQVAVLNDPRLLDAIRSIDAQTRRPDRILIVAAPATPQPLLDAAVAAAPHVPVVAARLPGYVTEARARAMPLLTEEITVFFDADGTAPPDWLGQLVAPLERGAAAFAGGPTRPLRPPENSIERYIVLLEASIYEGLVPQRVTYLPLHNTAWRTADLQRLGFDGRLPGAEDHDLETRAAHAGLVGAFVPEAWVFHDKSNETSFLKWLRRRYRNYLLPLAMSLVKNGELRSRLGERRPAVKHPLRYVDAAMKPVALVDGYLRWHWVRRRPVTG